MNPALDRRGLTLAWLGGVTCLLAFIVLLLVSLYGVSASVFAAAWLTLGMVGVWVVTGVQLHQQRLLEEERLEVAELERERRERLGGSKTIFDETDLEQMDALSMGRRLRVMEKWFVPVAALLVAAYHAVMGFLLLPIDAAPHLQMVRAAGTTRVRHALALFFTALAVSFIAFLISRAALSLARLKDFRLVRAGGNAMFGVTIATLVGALSVGATNVFEWGNFERWTTAAIGILMLVLAVETVLNFVFDLYRPRVAGVEQRTFYDSRLLGMFSEPGGILKSLADAVDYQFGFKVSETWFYQLLGRWIVPLLLLQALVTWLLTSITVVPPGYQGVIERLRWGSSGYTQAGPGIHVTWPWPLDRARLISTERVQRFEIGYAREKETDANKRPNDPELWTTRHKVEEYGLLVPDKLAAVDKSLPLNLLSVTIPIQWRVKPDRVLDYYKQAQNLEPIVEAQAYRVLTRFAAGADISNLLSTGGSQAAEIIRNELQNELNHAGVDGADMGVEILHVSLANIHPITTAADAYEGVVNAFQQKEGEIRRAAGVAEATKVEMGGLGYQAIYDAIVAEENQLKTAQAAGLTSVSVVPATREVERLLREEAGGEARRMVASAEDQSYSLAVKEAARAKLFESQVAAYLTAPDIYMLRQNLQASERILRGRRKYILATERIDNILLQIDLAPPVPPDLAQAALEGIREKDK